MRKMLIHVTMVTNTPFTNDFLPLLSSLDGYTEKTFVLGIEHGKSAFTQLI
ncbi:hypothetical protein [Zooshikella harenae]|uniref:Uncharacterized protein n=1 Tax=Zooshikella harenae TaxID=2827238 RepID=A0ABS5Z6M7_9GAMM|nr:hypothetical protein [Zooshikella harenae]MBU2709588.1 hypothetical protein [Zooshikella harenae]